METPSHPGCSIGANEDAGALHCVPVSPKTPKFSGKGSWEEYWAQSELLAAASHWPDSVKGLQLALSLTDDALACLLLLSPGERGGYMTLMRALQRRFWESYLKDAVNSSTELDSQVKRSASWPMKLKALVDGHMLTCSLPYRVNWPTISLSKC